MQNVEATTAESILEKGVAYKLPAPFFYRLFGKKEIQITVSRLPMGAILAISQEFNKANITEKEINDADDNMHAFIATHTHTCFKIAAIAVLGSKKKIKWFTRPVSRYLLWNLDADKLFALMVFVVALSRIDAFTNTIRLTRAMSITAPRNLSPTDQGS
jgi:hypothetical protein